MKINNISSMLKAYQTNNAKKINNEKSAINANKVSKTDKVTLSSEGQIMQIALQAVKDAPDVRVEKIRAIEEAVRTGTYKVDTDAIAEKLLETISFDKKA